MSPSAPRRSPYDTFRPVTGAWVARGTAVASVVVFAVVALVGPVPLGSDPAALLLNRVAIALIGVAIAAFLWRYALIRAVPTAGGLVVVNLFQTRELEWAQIVRVGFAGGAPWAVLELTDTEELPIMALQRADGQRARREASRLAALIEHHQRSPERPQPG
ncbi:MULTISPECIES: PH domain-containing protein [unclassified Ornithinimicrobium]|uniref:PH domain-containing protein n=1 Tax=unclassified Ornithinimicrobium TaxID=2615080 RepID=UPI003854E2FE